MSTRIINKRIRSALIRRVREWPLWTATEQISVRVVNKYLQ